MTDVIYRYWSATSSTAVLQDRLAKVIAQIEGVQTWPDDDSILYRTIAERDAIRAELEQRRVDRAVHHA